MGIIMIYLIYFILSIILENHISLSQEANVQQKEAVEMLESLKELSELFPDREIQFDVALKGDKAQNLMPLKNERKMIPNHQYHAHHNNHNAKVIKVPKMNDPVRRQPRVRADDSLRELLLRMVKDTRSKEQQEPNNMITNKDLVEAFKNILRQNVKGIDAPPKNVKNVGDLVAVLQKGTAIESGALTNDIEKNYDWYKIKVPKNKN